MISVQNHLQQLSGNKFIWFITFLTLLSSCKVSQRVVNDPAKDVQIVKADNKPKKEKDSVEIIKENEKQSNAIAPLKVDTILWKKPVKTKPSITTTLRKSNFYSDEIILKDDYSISLLIPLNAEKTINSDMSQSRFIHFYAGVLMALDQLNLQKIRINLNVVDTEEQGFRISNKFGKMASQKPDLVIGPYERDDVKFIVEECKSLSIPVVSPWQTSTKIATENPFYIQLKPNLKEHFFKLAQSTCNEFQKGEVVIIGKNDAETKSWIEYFQLSAKAVNPVNGPDFFKTYIIPEDSLKPGATAFKLLLKNSNIKAVVIPNYTSTDEMYIFSCLRRLMVDKLDKQIAVYGMPVLFDSDKIDFEFYHSLQLRFVSSDFIDENQSNVVNFKKQYLDKYGEIPLNDALKAYDMMMILGKNIWKYGKNFQHYLKYDLESYLQNGFDIKQSFSDERTSLTDESKFDYYENKHLDIIEFNGIQFQKRF